MPRPWQNWSVPFSPRAALCCAMDSSTGPAPITRGSYPRNLGFTSTELPNERWRRSASQRASSSSRTEREFGRLRARRRDDHRMADNGSILVTGAAGQLGAVGRTVTGLLLDRGLRVRAMVRREDDRAAALRAAGAEVVVGDLLEPADVHRIVSGCRRVYFGMSVSAGYLEATVTMAAVAREVGVDAVVNMSQMTVSQMSIQNTTPSRQQRQHWLSEQALAWSGLPVVTIRPTMFLETFYPLAGPSVRDRGRIELPFGPGKTSPVAAEDVARVVATVLAEPRPHLGRLYELTGKPLGARPCPMFTPSIRASRTSPNSHCAFTRAPD